MNLCDFCNDELATNASVTLLPAEMHALVRNGFGPCIGALTFSRTGHGVCTVATVSGLTEADVDDWWRKFVALDPTAWIACTRCHDSILPFRSVPRPDTRRPTLTFTAQNPTELSTLWRPGFGKTTVLTSAMLQKKTMSGIQEIQCDLCCFNFPNNTIKMVPANSLHLAIEAGFNPYEDRRIDSSKIKSASTVFGISSREVYQHWRSRLLADITDWRLCPRCHEAIATTAQSHGPTHVRTLSSSTTRQLAPKRWWQIWK